MFPRIKMTCRVSPRGSRVKSLFATVIFLCSSSSYSALDSYADSCRILVGIRLFIRQCFYHIINSFP